MEVRIENETVWLTQAQIAELFGVKQPAISKHLKNIYDSGELNEDSTYSILEYMGNDGKQRYQTKFYNLDVILSVGYRVNSKNATQFRIWANKVLKDYLLKGYAVNQRIENIEAKLLEHDQKIDFFVKNTLPPVEGIFFDGQLFDAYKFAADLIRSARKSIVLIDNYIDENVLMLFTKRSPGVTGYKGYYTKDHLTPPICTQLNSAYPTGRNFALSIRRNNKVSTLKQFINDGPGLQISNKKSDRPERRCSTGKNLCDTGLQRAYRHGYIVCHDRSAIYRFQRRRKSGIG